jgi:hypothetical protein
MKRWFPLVTMLLAFAVLGCGYRQVRTEVHSDASVTVTM